MNFIKDFENIPLEVEIYKNSEKGKKHKQYLEEYLKEHGKVINLIVDRDMHPHE